MIPDFVSGRHFLLKLVLILTWILTACRETPTVIRSIDPVADSSDGTSIVASRSPERPDSDLSQVVIPSEVETVTPPAVAKPIPSIVPSTQPQNDQCGFYLPLLSNNSEYHDTIDQKSIPTAIVPETALPALTRLMTHPESVGLAAFVVGQESNGVYLNADQPMPLASVVKVINLIAYANAVNEEMLDPASWIPLEELDKFYLTGMDLGAHRRALADLEERGLIAGDLPSTPLEELPGMMIRYSSNAAADYIHFLLGQDRIEQTAISLGLSKQTAPCPWIGQFLAMSNHERAGSDRDAYRRFVSDPNLYGQEVIRLTKAFVLDPEYRELENKDRSSRPSIEIQSQFSETFNAHGSPVEYASLMARILQNGLDTSYVNILVRRALEWPMAFSANQETYRTIGYKNGSLPGILTTVYYAERLEDGAQVVIALFFRNLPMSVYREWRQTVPHDELARWLLSDPDAINQLRQLLNEE